MATVNSPLVQPTPPGSRPRSRVGSFALQVHANARYLQYQRMGLRNGVSADSTGDTFMQVRGGTSKPFSPSKGKGLLFSGTSAPSNPFSSMQNGVAARV